jgi:hypothetical protein
VTWKALPNGTEVDLVGPVGDTLTVALASTATTYDWSGWSWTGQVREAPGAETTTGTFGFTDSSTATELALSASVAADDTADWTVGDTMVWAIRGEKDGVVVTFAHGRVIPQASVVA